MEWVYYLTVLLVVVGSVCVIYEGLNTDFYEIRCFDFGALKAYRSVYSDCLFFQVTYKTAPNSRYTEVLYFKVDKRENEITPYLEKLLVKAAFEQKGIQIQHVVHCNLLPDTP